MDEWIKAAFLGVVEGVTEFLPISSTGHLVIASRLIHFQESLGGTFEVFIQFGAVLAVLGFYAGDLIVQARSLPREPRTRYFWLMIVVAFLPAAVAGLLLRDWIKAVLFTSPMVIAWAFIAGGIVLIGVELLPRRPATTHEVMAVTWRQALAIGLAQVLALVPGVSRSGASIVGALLVGLDRPSATAFSFYLAIPTLLAATLYDLARSLSTLKSSDIGYLVLGTVVSGVVAAVSIRWLLRYVAHHTFVVFGIYRFAAGALILVLVATNTV
jgi:undecaprenyl-diphosphatase